MDGKREVQGRQAGVWNGWGSRRSGALVGMAGVRQVQRTRVMRNAAVRVTTGAASA